VEQAGIENGEVRSEKGTVGRNVATGHVVWIWTYAKVAPFSQCHSKSLIIAFDQDGNVVKVGRSGSE